MGERPDNPVQIHIAKAAVHPIGVPELVRGPAVSEGQALDSGGVGGSDAGGRVLDDQALRRAERGSAVKLKGR